MYQVILMYGDNEPWWFFEEWANDIVKQEQFATIEQAKSYYQQAYEQLTMHYTHHQTKPNFLAAFWNQDEKRWCEECNADLQQYKGLALLKDFQPISESV